MAAGNEAKERIINKIIECLGDSYLGCYDKKYYFMSKENGEPKQVAISLTCPKVMVGEVAATAAATAKSGVDFGAFGSAATTAAAEPFKPAEITPEERQTVQDLMRSLGL